MKADRPHFAAEPSGVPLHLRRTRNVRPARQQRPVRRLGAALGRAGSVIRGRKAPVTKRRRQQHQTLTRGQALAMLDDLYAQLPALECRGLCHDSCTAIDASELERERLRERGVELPDESAVQRLARYRRTGQVPRCPALGPLNTCTVYEVRPFICRAFGLTYDPDPVGPAHKQAMMCDHGCIPDSTITTAELWRLLREIERLSVWVTGVRRAAV